MEEQLFLEDIIKGIVKHPEDVICVPEQDSVGTLLKLHVNTEDIGTVIGKGGATAAALRVLMRVKCGKTKNHVSFFIQDPNHERFVK